MRKYRYIDDSLVDNEIRKFLKETNVSAINAIEILSQCSSFFAFYLKDNLPAEKLIEMQQEISKNPFLEQSLKFSIGLAQALNKLT